MTNIQPVPNLGLREKLAIFGTKNLADAELLAVFISSGNRKKSCLQLAYELIQEAGDLRGVLNANAQTFLSVSGLGMVRYLQLQAAKEICRRSDFISLQKTTQLNNTQDAHAFIKRQLRDKKNETFAVLFMDSQHRVISYEELFYGTINCASIHPRPIVERALALNAATIIVAHNHPSGVTDASLQDIEVTKKLTKAMELVDVQLLDHVIIGDNEIFSILHGVRWQCH